MGCACLGGSQVEQFLTDFIDNLRIRNFTNKKFTDFIERNNPFAQIEGKLPEFLAYAQHSNLNEHEKYAEDLLRLPRQYLCVALLFLTKSDPKSISGQYLILVDRLKNKFSDIFSKKLDDFYNTNYEVLKTALLFYCRMISHDVVNACATVPKAKITDDQAIQLKAIYSAAVIEYYVKELMKECNSENVNHEEFFQRNFQNLQHHFVRERLRNIWTSKFSPLFQKDLGAAVTKEGKIYTHNSNMELEKKKEESVNYINEPLSLVSAGAPVYNSSTAYAYANPMNATVYLPSQQQYSGVRRVIDLTNGNSSGNDLGIVASGSRTTASSIREQTAPYASPHVSMINQKVEQTKSDSEYFNNLVKNYTQQPQQKTIYETQLNSDLPSLVASGKAAIENSGAYIDPYNNATNKFLYGKEKIEAADVKNLPTKLFLTLKNYRKECLQMHNETRKIHQVPELVEDPALTERAQEWANTLAESDLLNHSNLEWDGKLIGENIAKGSAILEEPARLVCSKWYSEIVNYNFTAPGVFANTKNFTQMVWKDSQLVGLGLAYSKSGSTYMVVNYFPVGNEESRLNENVLPAGGSN